MSIGIQHGFSITLSGGGTYKIKTISERKQSVPTANAPHHGLAAGSMMPKLFGDVVDGGAFTVTVLFEGSVGLPALRSAHTATITHPLAAGESVAASEAGTGRVTEINYPQGEAGSAEPKTGSFVFTFDGVTGPALTKATASSSASA